jgi:iron complex transport system substrate-binding protein
MIYDLITIPTIENVSRRTFITGALASAFLIACGDSDDEEGSGPSATSEPTTRVFKDSLGNSVTIPTRPQRVVALHDYNVAMIMMSLGMKPVGSVGRSGDLRVLQARYDVAGVTFLGQFGQPDVEAIAGLAPDLIIGAVNAGKPGWIPEGTDVKLQQIAPTIYIDHLRSVPEVSKDYALVLGLEKDLGELQAKYEQRLKTIKAAGGSKLSELNVTVASFYYMQWGINIVDSPTIDNALRDLGVKLTKLAADSPERQNFISAERIREMDADLLIVLRYTAADPKPEDVALFDSLKVAQAKQWYEVDGNAWIERSYQALDLVLDGIEKWLPGLNQNLIV